MRPHPCPAGYGIATPITVGHLFTIFVPEPFLMATNRENPRPSTRASSWPLTGGKASAVVGGSGGDQCAGALALSGRSSAVVRDAGYAAALARRSGTAALDLQAPRPGPAAHAHLHPDLDTSSGPGESAVGLPADRRRTRRSGLSGGRFYGVAHLEEGRYRSSAATLGTDLGRVFCVLKLRGSWRAISSTATPCCFNACIAWSSWRSAPAGCMCSVSPSIRRGRGWRSRRET